MVFSAIKNIMLVPMSKYFELCVTLRNFHRKNRVFIAYIGAILFSIAIIGIAITIFLEYNNFIDDIVGIIIISCILVMGWYDNVREFIMTLLSCFFYLSIFAYFYVFEAVKSGQGFLVFIKWLAVFAVYAICWWTISLIAKPDVSKIGNGIISAIAGGILSVCSVFLVCMEHMPTESICQTAIYNGFTILDITELYFNMILVPFIVISTSALALVELEQYWEKKYFKL